MSRVDVATDYSQEKGDGSNGSGVAAGADSEATGSPATPYDTELVSNPFDFNSVATATLNVAAYYRDITTGVNNRFEVDVWDGSSWTNEVSWDEDHKPEDIQLSLTPYSGLSGLKVRFRYFGWAVNLGRFRLSTRCGFVGHRFFYYGSRVRT